MDELMAVCREIDRYTAFAAGFATAIVVVVLWAVEPDRRKRYG